MKLKIAAVVAVLALAAAGPSLAQQTLESTQMRPLYMPTPAVLGEVVGMTSHSVTVRTAKDEEMVFEFDSRTVMPMTMPPGLRVKVEFHLMDNGMQHAGRITRLEPGSLDWQALDKQLSLADQDRARRLEAQEATEDVDNSRVTAENESSPSDVGEDARENDRGVSAAEKELPKTASPQPLLLVLGAAATSLAVGLGLGLRRKHA